MSKLEYVKVEFVNEWMGNKPSTKMTILKQKAIELQSRGVLTILNSEIENKMLEKPVKNKMVEHPKVKKKK